MLQELGFIPLERRGGALDHNVRVEFFVVAEDLDGPGARGVEVIFFGNGGFGAGRRVTGRRGQRPGDAIAGCVLASTTRAVPPDQAGAATDKAQCGHFSPFLRVTRSPILPRYPRFWRFLPCA